MSKTKKTIDIFIFSGQSNMQGQSECPDFYKLPKEYGCEYKQQDDSLNEIKQPSGEDIISEGNEALFFASHMGYGGLMPYFVCGYYEACNKYACYIHASKGATAIFDWMPDTNRYKALIYKTKKAEEKLKRENYIIGKKYFVWLQGESDGILGKSKEEYKKNMLILWEKLKQTASFEKCLIIRVAKFYEFPCIPIMEAQEELCFEKNDFCMLTRITSSFTEENGLMQGESKPDVISAPFHYTNSGYKSAGLTAGKNAALYLSGQDFDAGAEHYPEMPFYKNK